MNQTTDTGLLRAIKRWDLVAVAINGIIGAGIFGLPSKVFALIGPYSLIAFAACGLVVALIVLCFAEVGSRFSETGGPYLYARAAFGSVIGFQVGWLVWLARLTAVAANCNLLIEYLSFFWATANVGWTRALLIVVILSSLTAINLVGVRNAALFSNVATAAKLTPIAFFVVTGLFYLNAPSFSFTVQPSVGDFSQSVLLLIYAFTGFEMAMIPAGEVRDPQRNVPFAILASLGVVAVVYLLIQIVCIGTLPELAASKRPLADAAQRFLGAAGAGVITLGAVISILGNLTVLILAAARLPYAMAGQGELPAVLAATHPRYRTPHVAILLTSALMLVLTLSGGFIYALTISTIARLLGYGATCLSLQILRRRAEPAAQFKAPLGIAVSWLSLGLIVWLLSHSTPREARDAAIAVAAGFLIYGLYRLKQRVASA